MKNICIIFFGNFEVDARCYNMAETILESKKFHLSIICLKKTTNKPAHFQNIKFYNLEISKNKILKYYDFHVQTKQILKQNNFNIVCAADLYSLSATIQLSHSYQLIYDCREIYSELEAHIQKPFYKIFWRLCEKYYLNFVNDIIVTAPSDAMILKNIYKNLTTHTHKPNFHTIYNFPKYQNYSKSKILHHNFNINQKYKIILYQGVIQTGRGIDKLIDLIKLDKQFVAVIIGNGVAKKQYINLVQKSKLSNKIFFMDAVPYNQLLQYTAAADIGWLVIDTNSISNQLALPNKLFEYTLMGLPVLTTNLTNVSPLIKKYNIGIIIMDHNNIQECKNAAVSALKIPVTALDLHNIAKKNFVWGNNKNINNNFLKILK